MVLMYFEKRETLKIKRQAAESDHGIVSLKNVQNMIEKAGPCVP